MAAPVVGPSPGRICRIPRGRPASVASSATLNAVKLVCSAGFTITALPAASAGPIFHASMSNGKFQGRIQPTTPNGSRTIIASASSLAGAVRS